MRLASAKYLSLCMKRLAIGHVCTELQNIELESWSHLCKAADGRQSLTWYLHAKWLRKLQRYKVELPSYVRKKDRNL